MKKIYLFLSLGFILSSCHQYYYVSSIQNVPMFREKNEFNLAGSYAIGSDSESGELQTAYSITDHLGITANLMKTRIGSYAKEDYVSGINGDFGMGYFRTMGKKAVLEVYSGYSRNKQNHGYSRLQYNSATGTDEYVSKGNACLKYRRIYLQPAFGLLTDHFDVIGSVRINHLWYTYIHYDVGVDEQDIIVMDLLDDNAHYILEPAVTLRTGWRYIKVQFQASYALNLNDTEEDNFDFIESPHISFGFYLTLSHRWNKL